MRVEIPQFPNVPEALGRLPELAYNLWWSWHSAGRQLFRRLDTTLWRRFHQNPVQMLLEIEPEVLLTRSRDPHFLDLYQSVIDRYTRYLNRQQTYTISGHKKSGDQLIAYFCAEFGVHNSLPIYSGGLGLLAGDTCKEASDLNLPLVAIGSLYPEGYFHQRISADGRQEALYSRLDPKRAPLLPVLNDDGSRLLVGIPLGSHQVQVAVWRIQVGRVPIYLMDTDIDQNQPWLRDVSARLYGGDHLVRLRQEIILGMGGVKVLEALGYQPTVYHLNEGHAAFAGIALLLRGHRQGLNFDTNLDRTRQSLVFTTHTPVKAGHDEFSSRLMEEYFSDVWQRLGIGRERFLELGAPPGGQTFSMTVLALRMSRNANAVSRRHGQVARRMWKDLWPELTPEEVPIISITNGVHLPTWFASEMVRLLERHLGPSLWTQPDDPSRWEKIIKLPDAELWNTHLELKRKLMSHIRTEAQRKWVAGEVSSSHHLVALGTLLDREALTIGFARRFATYKRATLVFHDLARLKRILTNSRRPVQIIFSGKAHPADEPAKFLLQQVFNWCSSPELEGHVAFVEDYDKLTAHYLVSGVDVWLNNPQPPLEASGTSGQKASLNGVPNLSVPDGWWYEGHNQRNGWAIEGDDDASASASLYDHLERHIIPLYYDRDPQGIPRGWAARMKESIRSVAAPFSARRMLKEYTQRLYLQDSPRPEVAKLKK